MRLRRFAAQVAAGFDFQALCAGSYRNSANLSTCSRLRTLSATKWMTRLRLSVAPTDWDSSYSAAASCARRVASSYSQAFSSATAAWLATADSREASASLYAPGWREPTTSSPSGTERATIGASSRERIPGRGGSLSAVSRSEVVQAQRLAAGQGAGGMAAAFGRKLPVLVVFSQPPIRADIQPRPLVVQQKDRPGGHFHAADDR